MRVSSGADSIVTKKELFEVVQTGMLQNVCCRGVCTLVMCDLFLIISYYIPDVDDGLTREFMHGAYSLQRMEMNATVHSVRLEVGAVRGNYTGIPVQRGYMVTMHTASAATVVRLNGATLQQYPSLDAVSFAGIELLNLCFTIFLFSSFLPFRVPFSC